jgi:hypothetical protein
MADTPKWFPIMGRRAIPWALIEPCERQAKVNHGQTLRQLAARGGLDSSEAVAVLEEQRRWLLTSQHPGIAAVIVFPGSAHQADLRGAAGGGR